MGDLFFEALIIALGIAFAGYFIGEGLKRQGSMKNEAGYYYFLKEHELTQFINLTDKDIAQFLKDHPEVPKVEINGKAFYPAKQFQQWSTKL